MSERGPSAQSYGPDGQLERQEVLSEIRSVARHVKILLHQMREQVDRGEYQLLIGDDASGRISTLFFGRILENLYKEKGYQPPEVRFFAGSHWDDSEELHQERVGRLKELVGKYRRALVVTDTIQSGQALFGITKALRELDIPYDIAAEGMLGSKNELEQKLGGKIFYATKQLPLIHRQPHLSGVEKEKGSLHAKRANLPERIYIERSRENVRTLSEDLTQWYKENKEP